MADSPFYRSAGFSCGPQEGNPAWFVNSAGQMLAPTINVTTLTATTANLTNIVSNGNAGGDAPAGAIGEYASASVATGSAVSLTTSTTANVVSVSLTAGDWNVWGVVLYKFGASTSYTNVSQGISTTSATEPNAGSYNKFSTPAAVPGNAVDLAMSSPMVRVSISATTTVYLVTQAVFTVSTLAAYGNIFARRVR